MTKTKLQRLNQGVTLYLTVMMITLILTISFSLTALFLAQAKFLRDIGYSVPAFYAAETGIERALYDSSQGGMGPTWSETLDNTASYTVSYLSPGQSGCPETVVAYCLKSISSYRGVRRGIRILR